MLKPKKPLLVFVGADWSPSATKAGTEILESPELVELARSHEVLIKRVEYSAGVRETLDLLGSSQIPTFLIFSATPLEKPVVLAMPMPSKEDVISALRAVVTDE